MINRLENFNISSSNNIPSSTRQVETVKNSNLLNDYSYIVKKCDYEKHLGNTIDLRG